MDFRQKSDVTQALDAAIAKVARKELDRLGRDLSRSQTAEKIAGALDALLGLSTGNRPKYDDWDALFYTLWYQPSQINLAYTLTQKVPAELNPLKGEGALHVIDFGCGALAVQIGLRIAHLSAIGATLQVCSIDVSDAMKDIGAKILREFEINYVGSGGGSSSFPDRTRGADGKASKRWLTAFHVAYRENAPEVKRELDGLIGRDRPDFVLVTKNSRSAEPLYRVTHLAYTEKGKMAAGDGELCNPGEEKLQEVNAFRGELATWPDLSERRGLLESDTRWDEHVRYSEARRFVRASL